MQNISDLIHKDASTMERIIRVVNGLWDGTIRIINNPNDGCIVCQVGDYCFYFMLKEHKKLKPEEIREKYDVFTIAQMILEGIVNLDDGEYTYCCDILEFV